MPKLCNLTVVTIALYSAGTSLLLPENYSNTGMPRKHSSTDTVSGTHTSPAYSNELFTGKGSNLRGFFPPDSSPKLYFGKAIKATYLKPEQSGTLTINILINKPYTF